MSDPKEIQERDSSIPPRVAPSATVVASKVVSAAGASIRVVEYSLSTAAQKALNVGHADKLVAK